MAKLFSILLFFGSLYLQGQVVVRVLADEEKDVEIWKTSHGQVKCRKCTLVSEKDTLKIGLRDSFQVKNYLEQILHLVRTEGYLAASVEEQGLFTYTFFAGKWYQLARCQVVVDSSLRVGLLREIVPDSTTLMDAIALERLRYQLFTTLENNGYPFVQVKAQFEPGTDSVATLTVREGKRCWFASPINPDFPTYFLRQITHFRKEELYSYTRVQRIEAELRRQNEWVTMSGSPKLVFAGEEVKLQLPLKPAQPNRFDFILGLLPNPATGRSTVTGTLDARLFNALKAAEVFSIHFERLRPLNQQIDVQARVPYLPSLPFGASGQIQIYRRDSSFLEVALRAGLLYQMLHGQLELFWVRNNSNVLQVDTQQVLNTLKLPTTLDLRSNQFAAAYVLRRFDNRFNPRRGVGLQTEVRVGLLEVVRNANIEQLKRNDQPDFDFSSLYDTLRVQGNRYQLSLQGDAFIPVGKLATLRTAIRAGYLTAEGGLLRNELYRLGGFELLRGFDEDIFFASAYGNGIVEMRLLTGERSYFSVFGEYSVLDLATGAGSTRIYPAALGAGLQLETRGGVFGLNMAVGKIGSAAFDFSAPKIHLGYLAQL